MSVSETLKKFYIKSTGYSYTNMGRLFLRLFVGIMLIQFAVRQINCFGMLAATMPDIFLISTSSVLTTVICIELACSLFIMAGFCTRLMTLPPFLLMTVAESMLFFNNLDAMDAAGAWQQQPFIPVMFMGIYFFILLVGPGKISVDYFLSLHFIHSADKSESELEEV